MCLPAGEVVGFLGMVPGQLKKAANNIRLAFFDIDGTLLDSRGHIQRELYDAIALLKSLGVKTAIASGRPSFAARFLVEELGIGDTGMFYTGAHIFNPTTNTSLQEIPLLREDTFAVYQMARRLGLYIEAYTADRFVVESPSDITEVHATHLRVRPEYMSLESLLHSQVLMKLLVGVNRVEQGDLISQLELHFPHLIFARAYLLAYPEWQFASVISGEASKARAFRYLLAHHQVDARQVMAFGDAESDMDFLRMAGVGIAMGNANEHVRAIADWTTKTADEAGVAHAINHLFR